MVGYRGISIGINRGSNKNEYQLIIGINLNKVGAKRFANLLNVAIPPKQLDEILKEMSDIKEQSETMKRKR